MIWWLAGLAGAATVSGTVTDLDGQPLAGVYVAAYDSALRQGESVGPTGIDGKFTVQVQPGRARLRVVPGMAVNHVESWHPGDTSDACEATAFDIIDADLQADPIALAFGVRVSGRLVHPDGGPLVGARVEGRVTLGSAGIQLRQAASGSDGRFEVRGLPADRPWAFRISQTDVPTQWFPGETQALLAETAEGMEGELIEIGDSDLLPGISVGGTVSGPDGALANAVTSVYSGGQIRSVRADGAGQYRVFGLPTGDITAWVDALGHSRAYWPDSPVPGDRLTVSEQGDRVDDFDVSAPFEAVVTGQLFGDRPFTGANVLLVHETGTVGLGALADADGRFTVVEVPPGRWNLSVSAEDLGYMRGLVSGDDGPAVWQVEAGETIDIQASPVPAVSLSGVVYDEAGAPLYDALVTARSRTDDSRFYARTERDGSWFIGGLPGGDTWDLAAEGDPVCRNDLERVRFYYPGGADPEDRVGLALDGGDEVFWEVTLPDDSDRDGMADTWELENGLDVGVPDGRGDPDGDGQINLVEYWEDTDPLAAPKGGCGCQSSGGGVMWIGLLPLLWGRRRR